MFAYCLLVFGLSFSDRLNDYRFLRQSVKLHFRSKSYCIPLGEKKLLYTDFPLENNIQLIINVEITRLIVYTFILFKTLVYFSLQQSKLLNKCLSKLHVSYMQLAMFVPVSFKVFTKLMSFLACESNTFGSNCSQECHCFNNTECDNKNGHCRVGTCAYGWTGPRCDKGLFQLVFFF